MGDVQVKKSMCFWCKPRCVLDAYVEDGRLLKVSKSPTKGCPKWSKATEIFYNPSRLRYPLKRAGQKGENKWEQISWDQAFDEITAKLEDIRQKYGAEALAHSSGTSRSQEEFRTRFLNLFGTPNHFGQAQICHGNSAVVATTVLGWWPYWMQTEKLTQTKCIMLIGREPAPSHQTIWEGIVEAKKWGVKLIVADPRRSQAAQKADIWLQVRPGTDAALLLSMIQVIIEEDFYDKDFVTKWCHGFEELRKRANEYPPERGAEITGVPAEDIRRAARMLGQEKPSSVMEGMGVAHQPHCLGALLGRHIIPAILGNIDVPGGDELMGPAPIITEHEVELHEMLPVEQRSKMIGSDRFKLYTWEGYEMVQSAAEKVWGKRCDHYAYTCMAHAPSVFKAMAYGDPYPVRALITLASNPMVTMPNTKLVYKALKNLELYVVADYFMTPSAELADYVLPSASWLERPHLWNYHNTTPLLRAGEAAVPRFMPGEYDRKNDYEFWRGLGIRLGQEKYWPWETVEDYYDYRLQPLGMTFSELVQRGRWFPEKREFRKYEKTGFGTPTGKVELYSTVLEKLGYDPLLNYIEPDESPVSTPEVAKEYPLTLITGARFLPYFHSEHRQVASFRKNYPHPRMQVHPDTAKQYGIEAGDWVWIESPRGRVIQTCEIFDGIDPGVVHAQHGWWYPELPGEEPWLHGVWLSNINVLTEDGLEHSDAALGSWPLKTMLCRIYKAETATMPIPLGS